MADERMKATDNIDEQRTTVLAFCWENARKEDLGEKIVEVGATMGRWLAGKQRKGGWPLHVMVLALDTVLTQLCVTLYEKGRE